VPGRLSTTDNSIMRSVRFRGLVFGMLLLIPISVRGDFLEQVGDAIRDGAITLRLALTAGRVPTSKGWDLVVVGEPEANLEAKAKDGRLESLSFRVPDNTVILVGRGLRPDVVLEALSADEEVSAFGAAAFAEVRNALDNASHGENPNRFA